MSISYRKLAPGDSWQYRKIRLESLKAHPESYGATYEEESRIPKLRFEIAIEQPVEDRFVIGAFDHEELIGLCAFVPFTLGDILDLSDTGTLIQMYVRSTYNGRKIGLNLTNAVIHEAFSISDINKIVLGVRKGNMSAIRVYDQAGFQPYHSDEPGDEAGHDDYRIMVIRRES